MIDQFIFKPKNNPWVEKKYMAWMYNAFPTIMPRAGYKLKELFLNLLEVQVIQQNQCLAREGVVDTD